MMRKGLLMLTGALLMLVAGSCEKKQLAEPVAEAPQFFVEGSLEGYSNFEIWAGEGENLAQSLGFLGSDASEVIFTVNEEGNPLINHVVQISVVHFPALDSSGGPVGGPDSALSSTAEMLQPGTYPFIELGAVEPQPTIGVRIFMSMNFGLNEEFESFLFLSEEAQQLPSSGFTILSNRIIERNGKSFIEAQIEFECQMLDVYAVTPQNVPLSGTGKVIFPLKTR